MPVSPFRVLVTLLGLALLLQLAVAGRLKSGAPERFALNSLGQYALCVRFGAHTARTPQQVADQARGSARRPRLLLL